MREVVNSGGGKNGGSVSPLSVVSFCYFETATL
jgi:hypothetical protein